MAGQKVRAVIIVEVLGRPAEHVKESLKVHMSNLNITKGVKLCSLTISEPKKIEMPEEQGQKQELYSCFAEAEIEADNLLKLVEIILDYMPSSIEVLEPNNLDFSLFEATSFLNDLSGRLHRYDEIAKIAQTQAQQLATRMQYVNQIIQDDPELRKKCGFPEPEGEVKAPIKKAGKKVEKKKAKKKK